MGHILYYTILSDHTFTAQVSPGGGVVEVAAFDTQDGLYDCAWNEENENILMAASGDGSIKVRQQ